MGEQIVIVWDTVGTCSQVVLKTMGGKKLMKKVNSQYNSFTLSPGKQKARAKFFHLLLEPIFNNLVMSELHFKRLLGGETKKQSLWQQLQFQRPFGVNI